ncbi:multidrug transporter [Halorientalis sp. IM1011]|uniref:EamA family transporter n=1 Tax=Halorientalis sp. IM1011 TaxID=1932360 RepID=UPI00097CD0AB|nr:EamA family transporter [Halorientalis sp. IM1011]AQL41614.1 multidrug transporter [Halorientalis sp. IM1011]
MSYLLWALLALLAYSLVAPLVKIATAEIPSTVVLLISNGMLVLVAMGVVLATDTPVVQHLSQDRAIYAYGAGIALAVGILAYYRALAAGPVSVVVPIYGLFLVTSSVLGIVILEESLTARKMAGIALAIGAVYLTAVE